MFQGVLKDGRASSQVKSREKYAKYRKTQQSGEVNRGGIRGSETGVTCPRTHSKLAGGVSAVPPSEAGYPLQPPDTSGIETADGEAGGGGRDPEGGERARGGRSYDVISWVCARVCVRVRVYKSRHSIAAATAATATITAVTTTATAVFPLVQSFGSQTTDPLPPSSCSSSSTLSAPSGSLCAPPRFWRFCCAPGKVSGSGLGSTIPSLAPGP